MKKSTIGSPTRRDVVRGIGAAGLGVATSAPLSRHAFAQTKKPVNLSFWTFDNPQQRPWVQKRVKIFTEQNPKVKVDFQWFAFPDLGKKLSVGFATGTSPDGFVSQDWFMPTWLDKELLAPLDVQQLGYDFDGGIHGDFATAFVDGATQGDKVYGFPLWFYGYLQLPEHQAVQGSRARCRKRIGRRPGSNSARSPSADHQGRQSASCARASSLPCTRRSGR